MFTSEAAFEEAVIQLLMHHGWKDVIRYPTEEDLLKNWANILYDNNREIDRLNGKELTDSEMQQIIEQINTLRTPLKLNGFINGKTVSITRDNPEDKLHFGKEVSLKIYDRLEVAGGKSCYQIVQQPIFHSKSKILNDRRGDLMLLINGMPVIHIELKSSKISVNEATTQIEKYAYEGIFTGLFSLVQVFVAMTPEETVYFANPGNNAFNSNYYFHWADFNNEPLNKWDDVVKDLLSIPMAHQLIGFYTVADDSDGILKVLRSYQYHAVHAIADRVSGHNWELKDQLGGFIWHTTGSGKTMTSFKSAQLIANSNYADKVVFLMDRIELGTQSLKEYRSFANENEDVQATENTTTLIYKLTSNDPSDRLIVTSIQKMSLIHEDSFIKTHDIERINSKRIVIIIDEAHRSTFGDMMFHLKNSFPNALFFGFTGTPIEKENQKKKNTTSSIFGKELHRYSIADGIRDHNVLGFDPYKVLTYKDRDLRTEVALDQSKAVSISDALSNPKKKAIFDKFMDPGQIHMTSYINDDNHLVKGIEDYVPNVQYMEEEHQNAVIEDIISSWPILSRNYTFHAIFATSSIPEAIDYYRLFKEKAPYLKVTALFDKNIDNVGGFAYKEEGLKEIIEDYNNLYNIEFSIATFDKMKKDIAARLSHKKPYRNLNKDSQIDILIVVDQMLTGFDSKWVNTLYLDKVLRYENIIQAFSRTNRLFGNDKPFGIIKYYRKPHTMEQNIEKAVKLYSGDKPLGLFVPHLIEHLQKMNDIFKDIDQIYKNAHINNFEKLPDDLPAVYKFADLFNKFNSYLQAVKLQGFNWDKKEYQEDDQYISLLFDYKTYLILVQRYKEIPTIPVGPGFQIAFDIKSYITEIDTGQIDNNYMNSRFTKYLKVLQLDGASQEEIDQAEKELHQSFASLTQEEQKFANIFLGDIQRGDVVYKEDYSFRDYITEYMYNAENDQIHKLALNLGLDEKLLRDLINLHPTDKDINNFGRFDKLKDTVDKTKAKAYLEEQLDYKIIPPKVMIKVDNLLRHFIINGDLIIQ